jgi:DNA polymerase III subunit epsilon
VTPAHSVGGSARLPLTSARATPDPHLGVVGLGGPETPIASSQVSRPRDRVKFTKCPHPSVARAIVQRRIAGVTMGLLDRFRRRLVAHAPQPTPSLPAGQPAQLPPNTVQAAFAVVDVETTGLSARSDRILELAIVRTDATGRELDEWTSRFNPQGPVGATHIHGIVDADVAHAPLFVQLLPDISARLRGVIIAGHSVRFDLAFLRAEYARAGWALPFLPSLCTLDASYALQPSLPSHRLGDCCAAAGIRFATRHVAIEDARAATSLLGRYLACGYSPPNERGLTPVEAARAAKWPAGPGRVRATGASPLSNRTRHNMSKPRTTAPALMTLLTNFPLANTLDEGAPEGALAYLHLLTEALADGVLSDSEVTALTELANIYQLSPDSIAAAHEALVLALAHLALDDGRVTRDEKNQLLATCSLLAVRETTLHALLDRAEAARNARLSADLHSLPPDWALAEPLHVGDKVVFTGCDDALRDELEQQAETLGVRVMNAVTARTAMLISDGSFYGTKADDADRLGTRVVTPEIFAVLLKHLQPAQRHVSLAGKPSTARVPTQTVPVEVNTAEHLDPAAIRVWARRNGRAVGERGRLPSDLIEAYRTANMAAGLDA